LSKQTSEQGIGKTKQQGNKNDWKQQASLNINTEHKWLQCPNQKTQNSKTSLKKNKTQPYAAYKRLISLKKTGLGQRVEKSFLSKWTP
jgi:hypothetical protein